MPGFNIAGRSSSPGQPSNAREFYRAHRWKIESLGIPSGSSSQFPDTYRVLPMYAKDLQLPAVAFEEKEINSPSTTYKVAIRAKWKPITVKFYDTVGIHQAFENWRKLIWTPEDGMKYAYDYKGQPKFVLYDNLGEIKQSFTLIGAYPSDISHSDLSYANSEIKLLSITYSYDYANIEISE